MLSDLTAWDFAALTTKYLAYGGSLFAAGSVFFLLANQMQNTAIRKPMLQNITAAVLVGIIASVLQFGVQCGRLMDEGLSAMMDPDMIELVSGSPLGTSVFLRIAGLILLLAIWFKSPINYFIAGLGAIVAASSFSFVGHGTEDPRWLLGLLISIHLIMVSFWIGALWPLHKLAGNNMRIIYAGQLSHRFGKQAAYVVPILIAVGIFLAWWIIGSFSALISTQYGWTLILKLLLVVGLLSMAAANKLRFVPGMLNEEYSAAQNLRKSIRLETFIIAMILLVTAVLTTVTPLPLPISLDDSSEGIEMENMNHGN